MPHTWDPDRYLTYADERGRPFVELVARIGAAAPAEVVDLGCGPGNLTGLLAERWPRAHVVGLDSSPEMIAAAAGGSASRWTYAVADLRDWQPERPVDVLVSNATLQWVPGHLELLPALVAAVAPGGWFAFQVPGNFDEPSHTIRAELAAEAPYAEHTARRRHAVLARPGRLLRRAGSGRLLGRRLGDDVHARAPRPRPRLHLGVRHRRPADPAGAAGRPAAELRGGVQAPAGRRRTRSAPTAPCCCRSAGSSRWPGSDREAPPRPGLLPAGRRGRCPPVLRRGARADRGREAARARRPRAVPGSGPTTTPARSRPSCTSASRSRSRRPARRTPRCCCRHGRCWRRSCRGWGCSGTPSTAASGPPSRGTAGCTCTTPRESGRTAWPDLQRRRATRNRQVDSTLSRARNVLRARRLSRGE